MIKHLYILRLIGDEHMAYIPGSIGRTMQGELFVVDGNGTAHNEGTPEFAPLWGAYIGKKRDVLLRLYELVHANYWDITYKQLLFGRPILLSDSELCILMYHKVLSSIYAHPRTDRDRITCVREFVMVWAPHLTKLMPREIWIGSLMNFLSSDIIYHGRTK